MCVCVSGALCAGVEQRRRLALCGAAVVLCLADAKHAGHDTSGHGRAMFARVSLVSGVRTRSEECVCVCGSVCARVCVSAGPRRLCVC